MVSWNSNNHSSWDRVGWIMSWGVVGGPRRQTWSSLRRGGDLPWERWVNTPCVQTLQSLGTVTGASHQEFQRHLHNPDIESINYDWIICYEWFLWLRSVLMLFLSVSLPFLFVLSAFAYYPFCNDHLCLVGAELKPDGDTPSWVEVGAWQGVSTIV